MRSTIIIDKKIVSAVAWDVTISASKASLERTMRALLRYRGWFTDHYVLGSGIDSVGRYGSVFLRVFLPEGYDQQFAIDAKVEDIRTPPRAVLS